MITKVLNFQAMNAFICFIHLYPFVNSVAKCAVIYTLLFFSIQKPTKQMIPRGFASSIFSIHQIELNIWIWNWIQIQSISINLWHLKTNITMCICSFKSRSHLKSIKRQSVQSPFHSRLYWIIFDISPVSTHLLKSIKFIDIDFFSFLWQLHGNLLYYRKFDWLLQFISCSHFRPRRYFNLEWCQINPIGLNFIWKTQQNNNTRMHNGPNQMNKCSAFYVAFVESISSFWSYISTATTTL